MKLKKKTTLLLVFTLGALLFASTALADIINKDGYQQLKDSLKTTAAACSDSLDSFTLEISAQLKDNGQLVFAENETKKLDNINEAIESKSSYERAYGQSSSSYYYSDRTTDIRHYSNGDDVYRVTEYSEGRANPAAFDNPFEEEEAADLERIADALVGSLRDQVMVEENADGSKLLSGSLTEVQIPALINAIVSLQMKQEFNGQRYGDGGQMPDLAQDVFVKEVSGSAWINPDGLLERMMGTAVITGKDVQGTSHELTFEVLFSLKDINSTTVVKPDLTGKKVEKLEGKVNPSRENIANPQKFIGTYKNDIIIEKDDKFVKIGERKLVINQIDHASAQGTYSEEYKPGYEQYAAKKLELTFEARFNQDARNGEVTYTTSSGQSGSGNIYLDEYNAKVNFWLNNAYAYAPLQYDSMFNPVLE